jgi:hypothetical protein
MLVMAIRYSLPPLIFSGPTDRLICLNRVGYGGELVLLVRPFGAVLEIIATPASVR